MNKKLLCFLPAFLLLFCISCEKEEEERDEGPIELFGKWEPVKSEIHTYAGEELTDISTLEIDWYLIQFNEDGYFIVYFDEADPEDQEVMQWSRSGDVVFIDGEQYLIESLTRQELVFSIWESETEQYVFTCSKVN